MDLETGELTADFHLWTDTRGREQRGKKAYRNTDNINITISPKPSGDVIASGHFSVPKVHNGENYYSVGRDGTQAVIKNFGDLLEDTGIKTNIDRAHFSRIDTFKNVITDEPFMTYSPLFSSLKASRKNTRSYGCRS